MRLLRVLVAMLVLPFVNGCCCTPFDTSELKARLDEERRIEIDRQFREGVERIEAQKKARENIERLSQQATRSVDDEPAPDQGIARYWGAMPVDERRAYKSLLRSIAVIGSAKVPEIVVYRHEFADYGGALELFIRNDSPDTLESLTVTAEFSFADGTTSDTVGYAEDSSLEPNGRTKVTAFYGRETIPTDYTFEFEHGNIFARKKLVHLVGTVDPDVEELRRLMLKMGRAQDGMSLVGPEDKRINETMEAYEARKRPLVDAMHAREVAAKEREYQERIERERAEADAAAAQAAEIAALEKQLAAAIVLVRISATPTELQATFSSRSSRPLSGVVFEARHGDESAESPPTDVSQTKAVTVSFKLSNADEATFTATVDGETRAVMSRQEYEAAKDRLEKLKLE